MNLLLMGGRVALLVAALGSSVFAGITANQSASDLSTIERVNKLFSRWDKPDSPGCVLAIIKNGQIIYKHAYGMADLEHNVPITTTTVFDTGSIAKQFTAMSIVLLAKQDKLSLDDDIRKFIPDIPNYGTPITIRHLIYHTSGLRDYSQLMALAAMPQENHYPVQQVLDLLARQKELTFKPGDQHLYSNSGYLLLAQIVKKVSGKSLREFAADNIFKPLGMNHTGFVDDHTLLVKDRAIGYGPTEDGDGFVINMSFFDLVGDGGLLTTVEDLLLWDQNFYENKLGSGGKDLIDQILTPGKLNSGKTFEYAFGQRISEYKGLPIVRHGGQWAGYAAEILRFPAQKFSVLLLANTESINVARIARQLADIYLADQFKPTESKETALPKFIELPAKDLENKTGTYLNSRNGVVWRLQVKNGKLVASARGGDFQFSPLSDTKFLSTQFQVMSVPVQTIIEFNKGAQEQRWTATLTIGSQSPITLEPVDLFMPTQTQLSEYVGDYFSDELQVIYKLRLQGSNLFINNVPAFDGQPLRPTVKDSFAAAGPNFSFARDKKGQISGFILRLPMQRISINFVKNRIQG
jgi:CubicO group peptidase (beta-lactamase class C family)